MHVKILNDWKSEAHASSSVMGSKYHRPIRPSVHLLYRLSFPGHVELQTYLTGLNRKVGVSLDGVHSITEHDHTYIQLEMPVSQQHMSGLWEDTRVP